VVICLERGTDCLHMVQLMPLHPKILSSLASSKSRLVLYIWNRLTQVVLEKRPLNGCNCNCSSSSGSYFACIGAGSTSTWKAPDASLLHKLRLRCEYLTSGTSTRPASSLPPPCGDAAAPLDGGHLSEAGVAAAVVRALPASSPSSPVPTRADPAPPRTRSELLDGRDRKRLDCAAQLDLGGGHVTQSMSLGTLGT